MQIIPNIDLEETEEERRRRKARESVRRFRANNLEKVRESDRSYRANNLEKVREKNRRWRANNRDKVCEDARRWRANNPEKAIEISRRWRERNPEQSLECTRRWRKNNSEKAREYARQYRKKRARIKAALLPPGEILKTALLQNDLYAEASRQVPAGLPSFIRDDIISDIVIAVLDGEISAADIALKAKGIIKAYWRQFSDQRLVSLDDTVPGTDLKRIDRISNEDALYA